MVPIIVKGTELKGSNSRSCLSNDLTGNFNFNKDLPA